MKVMISEWGLRSLCQLSLLGFGRPNACAGRGVMVKAAFHQDLKKFFTASPENLKTVGRSRKEQLWKGAPTSGSPENDDGSISNDVPQTPHDRDRVRQGLVAGL